MAGAGSTRTHSRYISYSVQAMVIAPASANHGRAKASANGATKIDNGWCCSSVSSGAACAISIKPRPMWATRLKCRFQRRQPFCTYMTASVDDGVLTDVTLHRI